MACVDDDCMICLAPMQFNAFRVPGCRHVMHYECLKAHCLRNRLECPACRGPVPSSILREAQKQHLHSAMDLAAPRETEAWAYEHGSRTDTWWLFTPEVSADIERAYRLFLLHEGPARVSIAVLPTMMADIDFEVLTQRTRDKTRRIKRFRAQDSLADTVCGVAGVLYRV